MRKTEIICDICGKPIDGFPHMVRLIRNGLIKRHLDYEVCSECLNQIEDFVNDRIKEKLARRG